MDYAMCGTLAGLFQLLQRHLRKGLKADLPQTMTTVGKGKPDTFGVELDINKRRLGAGQQLQHIICL
ncbi:hypothetical protein C8J23_113103 [Shewanella chilikensis]|uniref:Uncharacterized protein n=1 Tax=Shewanella chilikensis TaxID=558541 RepID=A0ABX5PNX3_9GAMM|nr:hypothetical protein C8J23_113103 [Shewanella chilikensis]